MNMDNESYARFVRARAPRSPILKNCLWAFVIGGGICLLGEIFNQLFTRVGGMTTEAAGTVTAIILIFMAIVLTGVGLFDRIARVAGGGTLVPITGFANAVASPAIDARAEGFVLGVGAKIFTVAGPVLLYGTAAGALYGFIYWLSGIFIG